MDFLWKGLAIGMGKGLAIGIAVFIAGLIASVAYFILQLLMPHKSYDATKGTISFKIFIITFFVEREAIYKWIFMIK